MVCLLQRGVWSKGKEISVTLKKKLEPWPED